MGDAEARLLEVERRCAWVTNEIRRLLGLISQVEQMLAAVRMNVG